MESVKTEPDPDGELYSSSQSDYQPSGIKEDEDDPLLIRCPLMKTENEAFCVLLDYHCQVIPHQVNMGHHLTTSELVPVEEIFVVDFIKPEPNDNSEACPTSSDSDQDVVSIKEDKDSVATSPVKKAEHVALKTNEVLESNIGVRPALDSEPCDGYTDLKEYESHDQDSEIKKNSFSELESLNSQKRIHSCDICKKVFTDRGNLKQHHRVHTGERPYSCDICKKAFTQHSGLKRHLYVHTGQRPFSCNICNKSFNVHGNLKQHLRVHSGERPYLCDICTKAFSVHYNLMQHQRMHSGQRPYSCDTCKRSFGQRGHLKKHQLVHTGERPYSCNICKKAFTAQGNLKQHQRVHTGERPYSCDICRNVFAHRSHLKQHLRVHTGERPYSCNVCKQTFPRHDTLKQHQRTHTEEHP